MSRARQLAADLLTIEAVKLAPDDPFTWASGLRSPIYCDNRLTLAYPRMRRLITDGFKAMLERHGWDPDVVVGTATAGIPHAAWLAGDLNLPMAYVRSKAKAHGRGNRIEGVVQPGQHVLVVEDLISTGASSLSVVEALREAGAEVLGLVAIFSYGLSTASEAFASLGVPFETISSFPVLLELARDEESITADQAASLEAWHADPKAWSNANAK
ncbi:MAG: orotate phosphoribosyltransferase [Bacteroidota bacterium]